MTTMKPKLVKFQEWFNMRIAPLLGKGIFLEFDFSGIEALQEDPEAKQTRRDAQLANGERTINELRAEDNLEPQPWGDTWYKPIGIDDVQLGTAQPAEAPEEAEFGVLAGKRMVFTPERSILIAKKFSIDIRRRSVPLAREIEAWLKTVAARESREIAGITKNTDTGLVRIFKQVTPEDLTALEEILIEFGFKQFDSAGRAAAAEVNGRFRLGDISEISIEEMLTKRADQIASVVNEAVQGVIADSFQLDPRPTVAELAAQIRDSILGSPAGPNLEFGARAERIARTETGIAANMGIEEGYRQSGVDGKQWITIVDGANGDRAHDDIHNVIVGIDDTFETPNGNQLRFPLDPGAPVGDIVNCRCTIAPVIRITRRVPRGFMVKAIEVQKKATTETEKPANGDAREAVH